MRFDLLRYLVSLPGIALVATNIVFIVRAQELFPRKTCRFWRVFFVGKSMITAASAMYLWTTSGHLIYWRGSVLLAGYLIALAALVYAFWAKPFLGVPLEDVVPASSEKTIVKSREVE